MATHAVQTRPRARQAPVVASVVAREVVTAPRGSASLVGLTCPRPTCARPTAAVLGHGLDRHLECCACGLRVAYVEGGPR